MTKYSCFRKYLNVYFFYGIVVFDGYTSGYQRDIWMFAFASKLVLAANKIVQIYAYVVKLVFAILLLFLPLVCM